MLQVDFTFLSVIIIIGRRCMHCNGCTRADCGECIYCKDKKKFGGPGKKKRACMLKVCTSSLSDEINTSTPCDEFMNFKVRKPDDRCPDEASKFLSLYKRKRLNICDDGNCLFRCLSSIFFGNQDRHFEVRLLLVTIVEKNPSYFTSYCLPLPVQQHAQEMAQNKKWGTHVEIFAASLFLKKPIYVAVRRSNSYYWAKYLCLPEDDLLLLPKTAVATVKVEHSIELCHINDNHYDCVVMSDTNYFSTAPPYIGDSSSSISLE